MDKKKKEPQPTRSFSAVLKDVDACSDQTELEALAKEIFDDKVKRNFSLVELRFADEHIRAKLIEIVKAEARTIKRLLGPDGCEALGIPFDL
jgi:hypothetical protein